MHVRLVSSGGAAQAYNPDIQIRAFESMYFCTMGACAPELWSDLEMLGQKALWPFHLPWPLRDPYGQAARALVTTLLCPGSFPAWCEQLAT